MLKIIFALNCLFAMLYPVAASAWTYQGHKVVGSIADKLLKENAKQQVKQILGSNLDLRRVGPWPDCVKSVVRHDDGNFEYVVDPAHLEYEVPCTPFKSDEERAAMVDYAARNWTTCLYQPDPTKPPRGCHNTFHYADVAIQRGRFDRNFKGTNERDVVAAINAAIAVLSDKPPSPSFSFKNKKEALFVLAHLVGDLHQPLHVGSVYLDTDGKLVDPDAAGAIDPATDTIGGNAIQDQNVSLHQEWDDIPTDIGEASTRELLVAAKRVLASEGPIEDWPAAWATDSILVARDAFAGLTFKFNPPEPPDTRRQWFVSFDDHTTYLWLMDLTKRRQLAKGGARLAEILNKIWP
jgi:S1/P1 Nuclease